MDFEGYFILTNELTNHRQKNMELGERTRIMHCLAHSFRCKISSKVETSHQETIIVSGHSSDIFDANVQLTIPSSIRYISILVEKSRLMLSN